MLYILNEQMCRKSIGYLFSYRTILKNSKGSPVSTLRDRSRDLSIYKKLSGGKNKEEAEKVAKMVTSVHFSAEIETEKLQKAPSGDEGKLEVRKIGVQRTLSTESYEYIDVDDMDEMGV